MERDRALARGREAGRRLAWREAYTSLSLADQSSSFGHSSGFIGLALVWFIDLWIVQAGSELDQSGPHPPEGSP